MLRYLSGLEPVIKLSTNHIGAYQATTAAFRSCKSTYLQLGPTSILSFSSSSSLSSNHAKRYVTTLTSEQINSVLRRDEISIDSEQSKSATNNQYLLPSYVKSIECNQLSSNCPIEDRIRISTVNIPDSQEPTLILGVFDGHGGGTTADLISRRLFNYISLALHPERVDLKDLHHCPEPKHDPASLQPEELDCLAEFKRDISQNGGDIVANLRASFIQCDQDLSKEIQKNLITQTNQSQATLHYYLSAAVSGCCAIVMVIHQGISYLASVGDCRAVLSQYNDGNNVNRQVDDTEQQQSTVTELLEEHNCDNVNEVKRLLNSHPLSEQNTLIKQNRLLGHLMPFRAFGDFQYKWPADVIVAAGLTKAFGSGLVPLHYQTPPYLIAEPDIKVIDMISSPVTKHDDDDGCQQAKCLVMATDGLWELFESSRDVIEALSEHSATKRLLESSTGNQDVYIDEDFDENSATHMLRSALRSSSVQDIGMNSKELKRMHHVRLEAMLTLPKSISRNFRDDISLVVLKLKT